MVLITDLRPVHVVGIGLHPTSTRPTPRTSSLGCTPSVTRDGGIPGRASRPLSSAPPGSGWLRRADAQVPRYDRTSRVAGRERFCDRFHGVSSSCRRSRQRAGRRGDRRQHRPATAARSRRRTPVVASDLATDSMSRSRVTRS